MPAKRPSTKSARPRKPRRKKVAAGSVGLEALEVKSAAMPREVASLASSVEADGGAVLSPYRDPLGGKWVLLVSLPIEHVAPTPYQRDLSESHVKRLTDVLAKTGRFLDPIIAVRMGEKQYHTPNGHHRWAAMKASGAKAICALLVPEPEVALEILALNTEKAHNLREKSLEVVRMFRALAAPGAGKEADHALYFDEPAYITLGMCYEERPRFGGGAYFSPVRRVDTFLDETLDKAKKTREARARRLLELDELVGEAVKKLRERGLTSPYLRAFVVARVNPLRFWQGDLPDYDALLDQMIAKAKRFDPGKINPQDVAASGGAPDEE